MAGVAFAEFVDALRDQIRTAHADAPNFQSAKHLGVHFGAIDAAVFAALSNREPVGSCVMLGSCADPTGTWVRRPLSADRSSDGAACAPGARVFALAGVCYDKSPDRDTRGAIDSCAAS